jgi:hypothetical protein
VCWRSHSITCTVHYLLPRLPAQSAIPSSPPSSGRAHPTCCSLAVGPPPLLLLWWAGAPSVVVGGDSHLLLLVKPTAHHLLECVVAAVQELKVLGAQLTVDDRKVLHGVHPILHVDDFRVLQCQPRPLDTQVGSSRTQRV